LGQSESRKETFDQKGNSKLPSGFLIGQKFHLSTWAIWFRGFDFTNSKAGVNETDGVPIDVEGDWEFSE